MAGGATASVCCLALPFIQHGGEGMRQMLLGKSPWAWGGLVLLCGVLVAGMAAAATGRDANEEKP
jgi:hypothetical protein